MNDHRQKKQDMAAVCMILLTISFSAHAHNSAPKTSPPAVKQKKGAMVPRVSLTPRFVPGQTFRYGMEFETTTDTSRPMLGVVRHAAVGRGIPRRCQNGAAPCRKPFYYLMGPPVHHGAFLVPERVPIRASGRERACLQCFGRILRKSLRRTEHLFRSDDKLNQDFL